MSSSAVRFLLVDDLADNLAALDALLRRDGLELHHARSGAEALERMLANDYALALLDVHMPDMDGYELAELMRGTGRTRHIPIIFLTASALDERRRFRGYEAGAVDYITKPIDPMILRSKAEVFYEIGRQAQELARQRDEMAEVSRDLAAALARLRAHTDNSPLALVEFDCGLTIRDWSEGAARMFGRPASAMVGRAVAETGWVSAAEAARLRDWLEVMGTQDAPRASALPLAALHAGGRRVDCECYGSVIPGCGTTPRTMSLQILDVTERRRAEETRSLLIGELNHRVKNTLADVQAIARQTLRTSKDPAGFTAAFTGRLQAVAGAHSLLSAATWSGADLPDLVAEEIRAGTLDAERLHLSGPPVRLPPEDALRMALSLHELATNAAKYGALSVPAGRVELSWRLGGGELELRWAERGGPEVAPPRHDGFGSTLIAANAAAQDGTAEADWRPEGVVWTLRLGLRAAADDTHPPAQPLPAARSAPPAEGALPLLGRRLLVVEDEVLVAMEVTAELEEAGAEILGVAHSVEEALALARRVPADAAVLDGNLRGEPVEPVAAALAERGIGFCFLSGYGRDQLPAAHAGVPVVDKPFETRRLIAALLDVLPASAAPAPRAAAGG